MQRTKLCNGVNLNVINSNKLKTNYMSVNFIVPLNKTNAHLTALVPKVLARGCKNYPDMAKISERLEYLYDAGISPVYVKRAQSIIVGFSSDFIKDSFIPDKTDLLSDVCDLLFSIIFDTLTVDGAFKNEYVENEKNDLVNIINSKINNKAAYAKDKCTEMMFEGHPYGECEYGTVENVKAATSEQVYKRYLEIINTCPIEIFFNGECDADILSEIVKKYVPDCAERKTEFPEREILKGDPEKVKELSEKMPVAQGKLVMGFRIGGVNVNTEDAPAFSVFNELFGGSPSSKLFMNVREAMSLCYYCRSMPDMFMSAMFVSSGIETENRDKATKAILAQLDAMKKGDFDDEDMADAKRSIKNAYKELDDSASSICLWHLSRVIAGNMSTPEAVCQKILEVTKQDIVDVAGKVHLDSVYFIEGTGNTDSAEVAE